MTNENSKHVLFKHDYLNEIKERLTVKADLLNVSSISRQTNVPRTVIQSFMSGNIPNTNFNNIVALYRFIEEQHI